MVHECELTPTSGARRGTSRRQSPSVSSFHFGTMLIGRSRRGKNGFRLRDEFFACDKAGRIRVDNRLTKLAQT